MHLRRSINNNKPSDINGGNKCAFYTIPESEVPNEMRNPSIHRGYRLTNQPWSYYFKSAFHLHNETVNVWTHYIGLITIIGQIIYYFNIYRSQNSPIQWTVLGFGTCGCVTLFNSGTAHLLHSKSVYVNYLIFMFDYIGVVFWGFGTAFLAYYGVSAKDMYDLIGPNFMTVHFVLTYLNFLNICNAKLRFGHDLSDSRRKLTMIGGVVLEALVAFVPFFPRYISCFRSDDCDMGSLNHITIVCISFFLMTLAFMLHQPELAYPGRFDIIGQSHQIFHLFVIITQSLQLRALYVDFYTGANSHCKPDIYTTASYIILLWVICFVTIVMLRPRVKRCIEANKKGT